jgi:hypothetical protein
MILEGLRLANLAKAILLASISAPIRTPFTLHSIPPVVPRADPKACILQLRATVILTGTELSRRCNMELIKI